MDLEEADGLNNLDNQVNRGDAGDPYPGTSNKTSLTGASSPSSRLYDGSSSQVSMTNVSSSCSATMSTAAGGRGDTTAPTVVGSAPMPEKTGVSRKANVTASFSEATDVGKLNNSNVAPYKNNTSTPISRQGHARRQRVGRHAEPVRRHVEAAGGEHVMLGRALDRLDRGQGHGRQPARRERRVPGKLGGGCVYWWFKTKR